MRKIVIDTFGADIGDRAIVEGAFSALEKYPEFGAVIIGTRTVFEDCFNKSSVESSRVEFVESNDAISNDDPPMCIYNARNESSMAIAFDRLKDDDECVAMLSAGNTGAMFVGCICRLGMNGRVRTPVLSSAIPTPDGGWICLLDCGARMSCKPRDFVSFADLGSEFARYAFGVKNPRVGLLSVGEEVEKGNDLTKEGFELLKNSEFNFIGNIEGYDLLTGKVDVVVTDGFTGNALLKSIEGTGQAAMKIISSLQADFGEENNHIFDAIQLALSKKFDLNMRGGATFLGTKKPVIKMHGCATSDTVVSSIDQLVRVENAQKAMK